MRYRATQVVIRQVVFSLIGLLLLAGQAALAAGGDLVGKTLTRIPGGDNYALRALVQPDGKIVVVGAAHFGSFQYQITRYNLDGTLDATFATNGTILEPLGPGDGEAWAVALQADGKIVTAGHVRSDKDRFGLARFNTNGTLDTSFGGGGSAIAVGPGDSGAFAMVIQADGKIVLGGYSMTAATGGRKVFTLARYTTTDQIDTTFGTNGFTVVPAVGTGDESIQSLGIQADGRIVAAGPISTGGTRFARFTANGAIDGTWTTASVSYFNGGIDMVMQADGRIAVAGKPAGGTAASVGVLRMNADGTVDSTFGNGPCASGPCPGVAQAPLGNTGSVGGLALQSGKYVVSGDSTTAAGSSFVAVTRFTSTGAADGTFGSGGQTLFQPTGAGDVGQGIALRADGRIIVAGRALGLQGDLDSLVTAFTVNGQVDTSFNGGFAKLDVGSITSQWKASALQADGKLVTAGFTVADSTSTRAGVLARYLTNGTLDTTFGASGLVQFGFPANAVAIQADGKIVVAGASLTGSPAKKAMTFARFNANGSPDTTFGSAGTFVIPRGAGDEEINAIAIQSDGKIVGAGYVTGTFLDSVLVRLTLAGALDTTYNHTGIVNASMSTGGDMLTAVAIQADGRIVGAGWSEISGTQDSMSLVRTNVDGTIDVAFNSGGFVNINFGAATSQGFAMALQSDGKIVVAGKVFNAGNSTDDFAIARLLPGGTPDGTFGTNGQMSVDFGNHNRIFGLAILTGGKLLGVGETGGLFSLVQFNPNGALDTTFGTNGSAAWQINTGNDFANAVSVAQDGTLMVAGNGSGIAALARFTSNTLPPTFTLSVSTAGLGSVSSSPAGISCGTTCSANFAAGASVTLTATPSAGAVFTAWSGDCSGAGTCQLSMVAPRSAIATFTGPTGTLVTRFRLYSPGTAEHLYTTDQNEYNVLPQCCQWLPEGAIYRVFRGAGNYGGVDAVPYYRLYNPNSFQHHWTTDANEYAVLATLGWSQEGIDGYILPTAAAGTLPLFRLFLNARGGLHLWTTDANERDVLTSSQGWVYEGIAGYVVPLP